MKICITGTPGTGKTKIANELSKKIEWKLIELNKLAEEKNLYSGFDKKRNCKIVDIKKINKEMKNVKGNLILESHYSHKTDCDKVILLITSSKFLIERLKKRNWKKEKVQENLDAEIMEVVKSEVYERFPKKNILEIDTSKKSVKSIIFEIEKWLNSSG